MNLLSVRQVYLVISRIVGAYALVAFRGPNGVPALMEKRRQITVLQSRMQPWPRTISANRTHREAGAEDPCRSSRSVSA